MIFNSSAGSSFAAQTQQQPDHQQQVSADSILPYYYMFLRI
jgi:hypothetical protein